MIHFGTGGWRAVIGDGFTKANVQLLTLALARKMLDEGRADKGFVIGYDRRFLSEEAAGWAAEVMAGQGILCRIIHRESPTPLIMYTVAAYGLPYGMAITASHNPAVYNGIKVFMEGGRDADETLTAAFEGYIRELEGEPVETVPYEEGLAAGSIQLIDPMNDYIDSILKMVDAEAIRSRGLHVVLDPMYGVSKTALQTILLTTRCDVEVIHERRDTLFGGRLPAPNLKTLAGLTNYVEEHGCDIGIATDGDADRLGVIDDKAEFLHPNKILVLLYYYLMRYRGWRGAAVCEHGGLHGRATRGDTGIGRHRANHGAAHDARGSESAGVRGSDAVLGRVEQKHRAVSGGLRDPAVPVPHHHRDTRRATRGERGGVAGGRAEKAGGWHGDDVRLRHCATERRSDSRERADAASGHRDGCANKRSNRIR